MSRNPQFLALVRHGLSRANVAIQIPTDSHYYPINGSDRDVSLVPEGFTQSEEAGRLLLERFPANAPLHRSFISPFRRIRETADKIDETLGYTPSRTEDPRLEKRSYGDFWNMTYKGVEELHPAEHQQYRTQGPLLYRAPNGENYPDVFARVDSFIADVVEPSTDNILVVSHAVVILSFERAFEGLSDEDVLSRYEAQSLPNGHIVLYTRSGPGDRWRRVALD
jgi:broad specificity phosphatase PhoE